MICVSGYYGEVNVKETNSRLVNASSSVPRIASSASMTREGAESLEKRAGNGGESRRVRMVEELAGATIGTDRIAGWYISGLSD